MTAGRWKRSEVHEALVVLYLRLNGYFTTGLVVHAPEWGHNRTEIDCLAIRHSHHAQPEREIAGSQFLALREGDVDLLICEVKSCAAELSFNERLKDQGVLESVLKWASIFSEKDETGVADQVRSLLRCGVSVEEAREGVLEAGVRVRGLLCCPPCRETEVAGIWCLLGSEILSFAVDCLSPPERRMGCSTRYNFRLWGSWLAPIVEYIKGAGRQGDVTLDGLYGYLDVA